jgi:hypothetical protein
VLTGYWEAAIACLRRLPAAKRAARGRDFDRLAGARVAHLAGAAFGDREAAEAGDGHVAAGRELLLDGGQCGLQRFGGLTA